MSVALRTVFKRAAAPVAAALQRGSYNGRSVVQQTNAKPSIVAARSFRDDTFATFNKPFNFSPVNFGRSFSSVRQAAQNNKSLSRIEQAEVLKGLKDEDAKFLAASDLVRGKFDGLTKKQLQSFVDQVNQSNVSFASALGKAAKYFVLVNAFVVGATLLMDKFV